MKRKPTVAELERILAKPDDYYVVRQRRNGSVYTVPRNWWNRIKEWIWGP